MPTFAAQKVFARVCDFLSNKSSGLPILYSVGHFGLTSSKEMSFTMGSVKAIVTENFSFSIVGINGNGQSIVEIKPLTKLAKDLARFKKLGRRWTAEMSRQDVFGFADGYEQKVLALAAI